jgi:hypothetical protein
MIIRTIVALSIQIFAPFQHHSSIITLPIWLTFKNHLAWGQPNHRYLVLHELWRFAYPNHEIFNSSIGYYSIYSCSIISQCKFGVNFWYLNFNLEPMWQMLRCKHFVIWASGWIKESCSIPVFWFLKLLYFS